MLTKEHKGLTEWEERQTSELESVENQSSLAEIESQFQGHTAHNLVQG